MHENLSRMYVKYILLRLKLYLYEYMKCDMEMYI